MNNRNESRSRQSSKARERIAKRKERRQAMVMIQKEGASKLGALKPDGIPETLRHHTENAYLLARDLLWYLRRQTSIFKVVGGLVGVIALFFVLNLFFSADIGPNISALGIPLGGLTVQEASNDLLEHWQEDIQLQVMLDGTLISVVRPSELGLSLDAEATAQSAKDAGLAGLPFSRKIEATIESDYATAQNFMLALANEVYIPPYEPGYTWANGELIGVPGSASQELDIVLTVQNITNNPEELIHKRRVELLTTSTQPVMIEPELWMDEAYAFVTSGFTVIGYDPFRNERQRWQAPPEEMASWLVAGQTGLLVRDNGLDRFVNTLNGLLADPVNPRYVSEESIAKAVQDALNNGTNNNFVRINYLPNTYTVKRGETGFSIGRSNGLPFQLVSEANPSLDWGQLGVGQEIHLPSRDEVVPLDPIPDKRIIVDLERLWLVGYENNEMIFSWPISIGMDTAPTSPGIYQILEKNPLAGGSSFALCADTGCGEWKMDYFMGIYEVAPGLTNGFHGAVLLPNGAYLDGGSQQVRSTFGCVMSDNEQAAKLYDWADIGTMVEILSDEFMPVSELALDALQYIAEVEAEEVGS